MGIKPINFKNSEKVEDHEKTNVLFHMAQFDH